MRALGLLAMLLISASEPTDMPKPGDHMQILWKSASGAVVLDMDSIQTVAPNIKSVIPPLVFATPNDDGAVALTGRVEFNCITQEFYVRSRVYLNDKAVVIKTGEADKNFGKVDPDSLAAVIWEQVCGRPAMPQVAT